MSFTSMHNDYLDPDRHGQEEEQNNEHVKAAFADFAGPSALARAIYKYTDCGPSMGMTILYWDETALEPEQLPLRVAKTLYGSDLPATWAELDANGLLITGFLVSSIVEGVDEGTGTYHVPALYSELEDLLLPEEGCDEHACAKALTRLFWGAVEAVDGEAAMIWDETHGCSTCALHYEEEGPVWPDCPDCGGNGTVI